MCRRGGAARAAPFCFWSVSGPTDSAKAKVTPYHNQISSGSRYHGFLWVRNVTYTCACLGRITRGISSLPPTRSVNFPRRPLFWLAFLLFFSALHADAQASAIPTTDRSHLRAAAEWIVKGDLARAEEELRVVLNTEPNEYHALNLLGVVRAQQHRAAEAEQLFKRALDEKPDFAGAHMDLGMLYAEGGQDDEAANEFQRVLTLEPGREDAIASLTHGLRKQAAAALKTREPEKALALLLRARRASPKDADAAYEFGIVALRMSLFPDAIQAFKDVLQERKNDVNAVYAEGRAQMGLGKFQEAGDLFKRYVELRPEDASGHYALGLILRALEEGPEARVQLERSIHLEPLQTESYVQLGELDLAEGNLEAAAGRFGRALERNPKHPGALLGMGEVHYRKKLYEAACDFLERSVSLDSNSRDAHYYLGLAYARLGKTEESRRELALAGQLEQQDIERHRNILRLLDPAEIDLARPE